MKAPSAFSVVLVEPEQVVNVGFVARTMACYGLTDFRIVGSQGLGSSESARKTGKGAAHILESIRHFESLEAAIGECHYAFGFTRRTREPAQRIQDLETAAALFRRSQQEAPRIALVFGRESQGLSREETMVLSHLVRIPMPDEILSLNISHAVAIALYAFIGATMETAAEEASSIGETQPTQFEKATVLEKLTQALSANGFFKSGKEQAQKDYTRFLWQRLQPTQRELDFLAGMLKRLSANS